MRRNILLYLCVSISLLGLAWRLAEGFDRAKASISSGRDKALVLVAAYAKHVGARDALHQTLDADNDRSFGDFGFHYVPDKNVLRARVFIVRSHIKDDPEMAPNEWRAQRAMDDPKIGGLYEHGGGHFILDEEKQACFLVKDYPVGSITAGSFITDMDHLVKVGARWTMSWGIHVADQAAGSEPIPTQKVTLENDPYARQ